MSAALLTAQFGAGARMIVEIAWGADLTASPGTWSWTDITTDLQFEGGPINISPIGRSDEYSVAQPAGCSFQVGANDSAIKYTKGPQSPNYPNVRRNTPVRVRVTLNNFSSSFIRFQGYITGFSPVTDTSGKVVRVKVTANGITRRLGQGKKKAITNLLTRYHLRNGAIAVWPFDDGFLSTQAANAYPNGQPMVPGFGANFGNDISAVLPAAGGSATLRVPPPGTDVLIAAVNAPLSGTLHIDFWRKQQAEPDASETQLMVFDLSGGSASLATIEIRARASQISPPVTPGWIVRIPSGAILDTGTGSPGSPVDPIADASWHNIHVKLIQSGADVLTTIYVDGTLADSHTVSTVTLPTAVNTVHLRNSVVAGSGSGNFDQQSVIALNTTAAGAPSFTVASTLYAGETVTDRLIRLCAEEGVPLTVFGTSTTTMGRQTADTFLNLLRECEATDLGVLFDGLSAGLMYVARGNRYNPFVTLTLNAATGQVDDPFEPKDDDLGTRNRITVAQKNGTSYVAEDPGPPLGGPMGTNVIGVYDGRADVNLGDPTSLPNVAGWLLYIGTNDEPYRYPRLNLDLSAVPSAAFGWISGIPTQGIDVTNVSQVTSQYPPGTVSLIVDGYGEQLSPDWWKVQANCSASKRWQVAALDLTFRLGMDGQTLAANLLPGATTLSLATAGGKPLHTLKATFPNDFPPNTELILNVGGWPIRVTDATGAASPQTLTIDPSPNTTTVPAGTAVTQWRPAALAL